MSSISYGDLLLSGIQSWKIQIDKDKLRQIIDKKEKQHHSVKQERINWKFVKKEDLNDNQKNEMTENTEHKEHKEETSTGSKLSNYIWYGIMATLFIIGSIFVVNNTKSTNAESNKLWWNIMYLKDQEKIFVDEMAKQWFKVRIEYKRVYEDLNAKK